MCGSKTYRRTMACATMLAIALTVGAPLIWSRTRTTRGKLRPATTVLTSIKPDNATDSAAVAEVDQNAIELRGYSKRLSDSKESFSITNCLSHRISGVRLLLRYTTPDGAMLHEREVAVPVALTPGQTKVVSVPAFDRAHLYYYFLERAPRKAATAYDVAYRLLGYDIPVGR